MFYVVSEFQSRKHEQLGFGLWTGLDWASANTVLNLASAMLFIELYINSMIFLCMKTKTWALITVMEISSRMLVSASMNVHEAYGDDLSVFPCLQPQIKSSDLLRSILLHNSTFGSHLNLRQYPVVSVYVCIRIMPNMEML